MKYFIIIIAVILTLGWVLMIMGSVRKFDMEDYGVIILLSTIFLITVWGVGINIYKDLNEAEQ